MMDAPILIPVGELGGESKLFLDYISGRDAPLSEILGGFRRDDRRWTRTTGEQDDPAGWSALMDRLVDYNRSLGVSGDVLEKLSAAGTGSEVRFVVTGQQPGVLGGSLLSLYKLGTAIQLAQHLEDADGVPCVPLYWIGADDADFQEIRDLFLVDCELTPLSTSIEQSAYTAASPVGDIPAGAVERVWEAIEPLVARCPNGPFVSEAVTRSLDGAPDHAAVTARIISGLAGGRAAVVDSREPAVRKKAGGVFLRFFDLEREVRDSVESAGRSLESQGYHAQLWLGPDSGLFKVEHGRRLKITEDRRAEARKDLAGDVSRFSPGVVLRNLVQDSVFRPTAVVLGPAEIAYRAQLDGVYRLLGIPQPVSFPRMQATYLPPAIMGLPGVNSGQAADLLKNPASFAKGLYASQRPGALEDAAGRFRRAFEAEKEHYLETMKSEMAGGVVEKTGKKLDDLSRRLSQALDGAGEAGKTIATGRWPFLPYLDQFVRKNDKPQDRYLSVLTPFLFAGESARRALEAASETFVQATLDGTPFHVVYST
ncbi:MAG: bacillithiol biosynthesis BshC [Candidatus Latescibacterota bacterium]|jgi:hypothetical protein